MLTATFSKLVLANFACMLHVLHQQRAFCFSGPAKINKVPTPNTSFISSFLPCVNWSVTSCVIPTHFLISCCSLRRYGFFRMIKLFLGNYYFLWFTNLFALNHCLRFSWQMWLMSFYHLQWQVLFIIADLYLCWFNGLIPIK